jgi:RNA polymerase sigma-70 factor (family 1)
LCTFPRIRILAENKVQVPLIGNELAEALQKGDEVVFEKIFKDYYERLCNYANTMMNDMDEAEEMVQSTFLTLWEKRENIDIHTSVKSYLYQAVHNQSLNRIKHYQVRRAHNEHLKYHSDVLTDDSSQHVLGEELEQQINAAIESLPPQCQTVFRLSRFENLTYAEISEQLNISVKTIENHMGKALRILRERLRDYLPVLLWFLFRNN